MTKEQQRRQVADDAWAIHKIALANRMRAPKYMKPSLDAIIERIERVLRNLEGV